MSTFTIKVRSTRWWAKQINMPESTVRSCEKDLIQRGYLKKYKDDSGQIVLEFNIE